MTVISAFLGNLPYLQVHGTEPRGNTLLPPRPRASHALSLCFGGNAEGLHGISRELHCSCRPEQCHAWCPGMTHPCFTDYSDYGDYWRANYEADYPEEYKYSRDQLMEDVEKTFEQVEAGRSSHMGHRVVFCDGGLMFWCYQRRRDLL